MARHPPRPPPRAGSSPAPGQCLCRACPAQALALRIDRYLHCIRLVKSRTLAQGLVEAGHVRIDGKRAVKPSDPVRVGSILALPLRGTVRIIEVIALPDRRGPSAEARAAYREIDEAHPTT